MNPPQYDDLRRRAEHLFAAVWPQTIPMPEKNSQLGAVIIELMAAFAEKECFTVMEGGATVAEFEKVRVEDGDLLLVRPTLDEPEVTVRLAQSIQRWINSTEFPTKNVEFLVIPKDVGIEKMPRVQAVAMLQRLTKRGRG